MVHDNECILWCEKIRKPAHHALEIERMKTRRRFVENKDRASSPSSKLSCELHTLELAR